MSFSIHIHANIFGGKIISKNTLGEADFIYNFPYGFFSCLT